MQPARSVDQHHVDLQLDTGFDGLEGDACGIGPLRLARSALRTRLPQVSSWSARGRPEGVRGAESTSLSSATKTRASLRPVVVFPVAVDTDQRRPQADRSGRR